MVLLYISLAISLWSAVDYLIGFFSGLKEARKLKNKERVLARKARLASRAARLAAKITKSGVLDPGR
jgi:hypothetical protein